MKYITIEINNKPVCIEEKWFKDEIYEYGLDGCIEKWKGMVEWSKNNNIEGSYEHKLYYFITYKREQRINEILK